MTILVGYDTAVDYWRFSGCSQIGTFSSRRGAVRKAERCLSNPCVDAKDKEAFRRSIENIPIWCGSPVHILTSRNARVQHQNSKTHCLESIPKASFYEHDKDILISSPEFCLAQKATQLDDASLILLAYEMCGRYSLCPDDPEGMISNTKPVTTTEQISKFLALNPGCHGSRRLKRVSAYVINGSASPMESAVSMLLTLPHCYGGYGLPKPVLNHEIKVPGRLMDHFHKSVCECDMHWPGTNLCVEYDSKKHHTGEEKIAKDAERRNILLNMGFEVITITTRQVYNARKFDLVANQIARKLGKRIRIRAQNFYAKQRSLRNAVLR